MVPPQTIIPGYSSELSGFKSSTKGEIMSQFSMLTSILFFNLHCLIQYIYEQEREHPISFSYTSSKTKCFFVKSKAVH